ncbi:Retrovirus-related Pol polyprotein from transposon TNT 1-94, partial [Linum perenne]
GYLQKVFPQLFANKRTLQLHCDICQYAKHTRVAYTPVSYTPTSPFSIIHSDIWGPSRVASLNGTRWFITMIDEHTRMTWTFLMKEKSDTARVFKTFYTMIENQFQTKIRVLRTDNAKDYFNTVLGSFLSSRGVIHSSSCVDTPEQNGIAERKNRHLLEMTRALMFGTHVPKHLWGEALLTATYLINRLPSRTLEYKSPRQILIQSYPHIHAFSSDLPLKVFGCTTFVHLYSHQRSKLDPRSVKCVFLGYSAHKKGYKCYSPTLKKLYHTMDVTFFEAEPYFSHHLLQGEKVVDEAPLWEIIGNSEIEPETDASQTETRQTTENESAESADPEVQELHSAPVLMELNTTEIPDLSSENGTTTAVANPPLRVYSRRARQNQAQTNEELMEVNEEHVESEDNADLYLPIAFRKGVRECTKHSINRWVNYSRLTPTYKAFISRLDSEEIPANINEAMKDQKWREAVQDEIKALEKNNTWSVVPLPHGKKTVDCKWIFTIKYKADGSIERYKARLVARGFTQSYGIDYQETFAPVAKLNTVRVLLSLAVNLDWPLYQLDVKNAFLNGDLLEEVYMNVPAGGYKQCQTDHTLFVKRGVSGKLTILIVYVDDIIITGNDHDEIVQLKKRLATEFEIKDLGHLRM